MIARSSPTRQKVKGTQDTRAVHDKFYCTWTCAVSWAPLESKTRWVVFRDRYNSKLVFITYSQCTKFPLPVNWTKDCNRSITLVQIELIQDSSAWKCRSDKKTGLNQGSQLTGLEKRSQSHWSTYTSLSCEDTWDLHVNRNTFLNDNG